jgi:hypothetical protein
VLKSDESEIRPPEGAKITFLSASTWARKIEVKRTKTAFSSSHRGQFAKIDDGWLIIDQQWYPKKG